MSGGLVKYRGWLIVIGIILVLLSAGMMKFHMRVLFSKMGPFLLLLGVALIALARLGRLGRKMKGEKDE